MEVKLEKFASGWVGLSLSLDPEEIEVLVARLRELASGAIGHFHIRNEDFSANEGVADIELSVASDLGCQRMVIE